MGNIPPKPVSPALVTAWLDRYRNLKSLLDAEPNGEWAWLWRVRYDVLSYLLHRYGEGVTIRDIAEEPIPPKANSSPRQESTSNYERRADPLEARPDTTHPARIRSDFRARLDHLHGVNKKVREEYPQEPVQRRDVYQRARIVRLSYPEEGFRLIGDQLGAQQHALIEADLLEIRALIAKSQGDEGAGTPLSDDEILSILDSEIS